HIEKRISSRARVKISAGEFCDDKVGHHEHSADARICCNARVCAERRKQEYACNGSRADCRGEGRGQTFKSTEVKSSEVDRAVLKPFAIKHHCDDEAGYHEKNI